MKTTAKISECGKYRYQLTRVWNEEKSQCVFIMLNPSTADENTNDPTIIKCMSYANTWELGGIKVVNLFAYRSTDKSQIRIVEDPIGEDNDNEILNAVVASTLVICAWGNDGAHLNRSEKVKNLLKERNIKLYCLKKNRNGEPAHPLYLKSNITKADLTEL